uniref:Putative glycine rich protein n=1 Tax=Rhipicephalus pulchellus TaxID=72859 RepID=L7LWS6_RHIPC
MDVTRHFVAFVLFATASGGLFQVQEFYQSPLNCLRTVQPVMTTISSPCAFPCALPLGDGGWEVIFRLERDGAPCNGGFCKSGICKEAPSFPVHNHLKQGFISEVKLPLPGFGYSDSKRNLQWLPPVNANSEKAPKDVAILANALRRIGVTVCSEASENAASGTIKTKHVAGDIDGQSRKRGINDRSAKSRMSDPKRRYSDNFNGAREVSGHHRYRRALPTHGLGPFDERYRFILEDIESGEVPFGPGDSSGAGAQNWSVGANMGLAGRERLWNRYKNGPTLDNNFISSHSGYRSGYNRGSGVGGALALLAAAGFLTGESRGRGSSASHSVLSNHGPWTSSRYSSRSDSFRSIPSASGVARTNFGSTTFAGSSRWGSSHGGNDRGGSNYGSSNHGGSGHGGYSYGSSSRGGSGHGSSSYGSSSHGGSGRVGSSYGSSSRGGSGRGGSSYGSSRGGSGTGRSGGGGGRGSRG